MLCFDWKNRQAGRLRNGLNLSWSSANAKARDLFLCISANSANKYCRSIIPSLLLVLFLQPGFFVAVP